MDCAEIRSSFVSGSIPEGPAVAQHLELCPQCRELFAKGAALGRRLALAVLPAPAPGELLSAVERDLASEVGARARLRALPTGLRVLALVGLGSLLMTSQLLLHRRSDFSDYDATVFWGISAVLLVLAMFGSLRLLRGALEPSNQRHQGFALLLLLAAPALAAWVIPLGAWAGAREWLQVSQDAWGSPASCFGYGAGLVVPFLLLAWLLERRDGVPMGAWALTGALAGVVANLALHAHCPSAHLGHLLLGHATIGAAWALGLALLLGRTRSAG